MTNLRVWFVLAVCLTAACGGGGSAPSSPDVWATVDGREIRRDDVEKVYRRVAQLTPAPPEEEAMTAKLSLLNELIVQDILVARAAALKIDVTDAELDTAFAERRKNMPDDAFQKELSARGLTADDMRAALRRELLADKVVEREVISKISISDQEITDYFNSHRAQFNVAEPMYRLARILITPVRDPQINNRKGDDATTPEAAATKATMLMGMMKGGIAFSEVARDYSEDPQSAQNGGDLGFVPLSALKNEAILREIALKGQPGNMNHATANGAHLLVLFVGKEEAGQRDLNSPGVKDGISTSLKNLREQLMRTAYLTDARSSVEVVNHLAKRIVEGQGKTPSLLPAAPGK